MCEGSETKLTEDYTWPFVNAIHKAHKLHVSKQVPGQKEMPSRRVENIKQGQGQSNKVLTTHIYKYNDEKNNNDDNFGEKLCDNDCPAGPSITSTSANNVHVGPVSRGNAKVDCASFDCGSISALPLLDASAHTLETARQSCLKLEERLMEQKSGIDYYAVLHDARKIWQDIVELKPAKIMISGYSSCSFCSSFLPASVITCPRCGLRDNDLRQPMSDRMSLHTRNTSKKHSERAKRTKRALTSRR